MKRILVTAAGGPSSTSFIRSLKEVRSPDNPITIDGYNYLLTDEYYIIGTDRGKYNVFRSEADKTCLCPDASHELYIPFLKHIIEKEQIDFMHSQPEAEIYVTGKHRDELMETGVKMFMPKQETIELLRDKWKSYEVWRDAGIKVPKSFKIDGYDTLRTAFIELGKDLWLRETIGAAGKGSLSRPRIEEARIHLEKNKSYGRSMAAQHLTDKTITWQSIWYKGRLVVAQGRKRKYWAFSNRAQSGVTGLTGTGVTVSDPLLDEIAIDTVKASDPEPHGIFSVDCCYDWDGVPNPTEINIGKFFTTHYFITRAGCNMPDIFVKLAFDEYDGPWEILNPCKPDMYWIRGIDCLPVLTDESAIYEVEKEYSQILEAIR